MENFTLKDNYDLYDLVKIIKLLRSPGGCPWDMEQTHESIRRNFLEEAYEACEAIDEKDPRHLCEELGDVLMQVVFHADIEDEKGNFNIDDVADGTCKKLIFRHPHIFSDNKVQSSAEVLDNWDKIKMKERSQKSVRDTMETVARSLPSMWRADKVISKAEKAGFKGDGISDALNKLSEKTKELEAAVSCGTNVFEELGDVIFSAVHIANMLGVDPEDALSSTTDKFISRFGYVEETAAEHGKSIAELTRGEMLDYLAQSKTRRTP